jgi:hypothetical protein
MDKVTDGRQSQTYKLDSLAFTWNLKKEPSIESDSTVIKLNFKGIFSLSPINLYIFRIHAISIENLHSTHVGRKELLKSCAREPEQKAPDL